MARVILEGIPVSPGIAIAPLKMAGDGWLYEKRRIEPDEVEKEISNLQDASARVCSSLESAIARIPESLTEYKDIISAQMELARDPRLIQNAAARIRHLKICAAWALSETIEELASLFNGMDDPYLRERSQDIKAIGQALSKELSGNTRNTLTNDGIIAAPDFSPADMLEFKGKGLITVDGGPTSHTAILARGLKVPAIVGVQRLFDEAKQDELIIIDGLTGAIIFDPDKDDLARYENIQKNFQGFAGKARIDASLPAITRDGKTINVLANLDNPHAIIDPDLQSAEGIGLYRTEFAFMGESLPDEDALIREYGSVLARFSDRPVVFRTLDVGADKILPESTPEPNPALGTRGIRFSLKHTEIFKTQLRAILRASFGHDVSLLLPMVSTVWEVKAVKNILARIQEDLARENLPHAKNPPLGVMVETPAAVMISDFLVEECDFLSIGTNDLLHYLLAIDRNNQNVSYLYDIFHPAFLRSLKKVIDAAHEKALNISVCGELAADPLGIPLLVGLGVDTLSAAPRYVPIIKEIVRNLDFMKVADMVRNGLTNKNFADFSGHFKNLLGNFLDNGLLPYNSILSHYHKL